MRRIISFLAMPLAIVGLAWLVAILYLQQSHAEVTGSTLLHGFVTIPLALVICWFGGKALLSALSKKPEAPQPESAFPPATQASSTPAVRPLAILSAEICTSAGGDLESILSGLRENTIHPTLSTDFVSREGLPVMAALSDSLDTESAGAFIEHWLTNAPTDHPARQDIHKARRLLALLEEPMRHTLDQLDAMPPLPAEARSMDTPKRPLLIKVFSTPGWDDMLEAWLRHQLSQLEGFSPGFVRIDSQRPELQHDALRVASAFSSDLAKMPASSLLMLVASDSNGSESSIEEIESAGMLFDSSNQNGLIPGEGAAVILSSPADQIPQGFEPIVELSSVAWGMREKAVNAGGRTDIVLLSKLLDGLLERCAENADGIETIVSDCDQRIHWNAEAASLISANLPALDPVADHLSLGRAFGHTGTASSALALACAAAAVRENGKPGFVASLADTTQRSLALLRPWPEATT